MYRCGCHLHLHSFPIYAREFSHGISSPLKEGPLARTTNIVVVGVHAAFSCTTAVSSTTRHRATQVAVRMVAVTATCPPTQCSAAAAAGTTAEGVRNDPTAGWAAAWPATQGHRAASEAVH